MHVAKVHARVVLSCMAATLCKVSSLCVCIACISGGGGGGG